MVAARSRDDRYRRGPEPLSDVLARRLLAQRVVLLHGPLDEVSVIRVSAELMTLDAEGDDPVTLRVDCGEAALAPALTLMDVIELMGVPVRALCLGQVGSGAIGVVSVCAPPRRHAQYPVLPVASRPPQLQAHVRNVAQWAELRAGERQRFCARVAAATGQAAGDGRGGSGAGTLSRCGRGRRVRDPRRGVPARRPGPAPARIRAPAHGVPAAALTASKTGPVLRAYDAAMTTTGPRLPPLPAGEWDDVLIRVLQNSPGGTDEPMHIFTTLGPGRPRAVPALARLRRRAVGREPSRSPAASW